MALGQDRGQLGGEHACHLARSVVAVHDRNRSVFGDDPRAWPGVDPAAANSSQVARQQGHAVRVHATQARLDQARRNGRRRLALEACRSQQVVHPALERRRGNPRHQ
jgi:hypothetical protein